MKDDEKRFLIDVYMHCRTPDCFPRHMINRKDFYMHPKRAHYLLSKWADKGWYEWGVTMDLGWLTDKGKKKVEELLV